jgi:hypothetical protein
VFKPPARKEHGPALRERLSAALQAQLTALLTQGPPREWNCPAPAA